MGRRKLTEQKINADEPDVLKGEYWRQPVWGRILRTVMAMLDWDDEAAALWFKCSVSTIRAWRNGWVGPSHRWLTAAPPALVFIRWLGLNWKGRLLDMWKSGLDLPINGHEWRFIVKIWPSDPYEVGPVSQQEADLQPVAWGWASKRLEAKMRAVQAASGRWLNGAHYSVTDRKLLKRVEQGRVGNLLEVLKEDKKR